MEHMENKPTRGMNKFRDAKVIAFPLSVAPSSLCGKLSRASRPVCQESRVEKAEGPARINTLAPGSGNSG